MRHVTINLSEAQEAQLSERIAAGEFASLNDHVAALVGAETRERARGRLEELLMDGLNSEELAWTPELMDEIRGAARPKR